MTANHAICRLVTAALVAGACSIGHSNAADWPTYHGHAGLAGVATGTVPDEPVTAWRYQADGEITHTPVAGDGLVFCVTGRATVHAVDFDGTPAWTYSFATTNAPLPELAPPLYHEGTLLVAGDSGRLVALEARTGETRWTRDLAGHIRGAPNALPDGVEPAIVVVTHEDGVLHALRLRDGEPLWRGRATNRTDGSPAVSSPRIVYGNCDVALYVFATTNGSLLASISLNEGCQVAGGVALHGGRAFSGSRAGELFCVDAAIGGIVWTYTNNTGEVFTTPAVDGDLALFGSADGRLYALDAATGVLRWMHEAGREVSSPVIAGPDTVFTAGGRLGVLRRTDGTTRWERAIADRITAPAVAGGRIFVGTDDGGLTAIGGKP